MDRQGGQQIVKNEPGHVSALRMPAHHGHFIEAIAIQVTHCQAAAEDVQNSDVQCGEFGCGVVLDGNQGPLHGLVVHPGIHLGSDDQFVAAVTIQVAGLHVTTVVVLALELSGVEPFEVVLGVVEDP